VDFALSGSRYDTSSSAPARWAMLVPWAAGFVAYQLTAPTVLADWASWAAFWRSGQDLLGISPTNGFSASVVALLVAGVLTPIARKVATVRS
jgi:nucleobase:cation symporter-1, NCS1 family